MKLTKGKKEDSGKKPASPTSNDKKKPPEPPKPPAKVPQPPIPVRIQVEPGKASTVSLEVKADSGKKAEQKKEGDKSRLQSRIAFSQRAKPKPSPRKKPAPTRKPKPVKSVEISVPKERRRQEPPSAKNQPGVTVSIFNSAAPAKSRKAKTRKTRKPSLPKRQKIEMEAERVPLISKPSRIKAYEKPSSVSISDSSGTVTEADLKFIRDFIARSGYLDNQVAEVRIGLSKITKMVDMFTDKVNSSQKDVGELKMKMASLKEWKTEKDVSEMKERVDEIEAVLEKMSDKFREYKEESEKSSSSEAKRMRSFNEEISGLKAGVKELREKMTSINTDLTKLSDFKAFVQAKAQEPQKEAAPDVIKNMSDRLDIFDSRIAATTERVVKISEDIQKLTSYFMEGIKHLESRLRGLESEKKVESFAVSIPEPEPKFTPTTYRSHLKQEPEEDMDLDEEENLEGRRPGRLQSGSERLERRFIPRGASVAMPLPPPAAPGTAPDFGRGMEREKEDAFHPQSPPVMNRRPAELPFNKIPSPYTGPPPAPIPKRKVAEPPSVLNPERGNMFTKLRESTVIRRPLPQEDPDMDIILEHIRESLQKQESREKITRDLLNAGFEQDLISRAFMRHRVG